MLANTRPKDLTLFIDIAAERGQTTETDGVIDLRVLVPAFMISRKSGRLRDRLSRRCVPVLVIDLSWATTTMFDGAI